MKTRGKNIGWTIEQDLKALAKEKVEGRTALQLAQRRKMLKNKMPVSSRFFGTKFLKNLVILRKLNRAPKSADENFISTLQKVLNEI